MTKVVPLAPRAEAEDAPFDAPAPPPPEPPIDEGDGGDGARGGRGPDWGKCPIECLGHGKGVYHFLDSSGQHRELRARDLFGRPELLALFGGEDRWLKAHFHEVRDDQIKLSVSAAAQALQRRCHAIGPFDPSRTEIRLPGIWADADGRPIVHLGDVLATMDGQLLPSGARHDGAIYERGPALPRPDAPCEAVRVEDLRAAIAEIWQFRDGPAGAKLLLGWAAVASLGAAARWRPNLFLLGESGAGKSELLELLRDLLVVRVYSNDTSRAGLIARITSRPGPILIEESVQGDKAGARALMDLMLPSAGGDGAKGLRGNADGTGRGFQVIGAVAFAAIYPPPMQAEHANRFTEINLMRPQAGVNNEAAIRTIKRDARRLAPALLGRVLDGFGRWPATLQVMRDAVIRHGGAPRDADQVGALLAGWWLLASDAAPSAAEAGDLVEECASYIPRSAVRREMSAAAGAWIALSTTLIQLQAGSVRRPIGDLVEDAFNLDSAISVPAEKELKAIGLRPAMMVEREARELLRDWPGMPPGVFSVEGVWFGRKHAELQRIFDKTPYAGESWWRAMQGQAGAWPAVRNVRIGAYASGAFFVLRDVLRGDAPPDPPATGAEGGGV